jgi:xanthine dehydrogenase YagT iron-sulfur-binding subunit
MSNQGETMGSADDAIAERSPSEPAITRPAAAEGVVPVTLSVNGKKHNLRIDPRTTLLDCLRDHLLLTGSKKDAITVTAARAQSTSMAGE